MVRDLRQALPNSVRTTTSGSNVYLEFLLTSGGGRYRASFARLGDRAQHFDVLAKIAAVTQVNRIPLQPLDCRR